MKIRWISATKDTERKPSKCIRLNTWQQEAFDHVKDAEHVVINAPMGSGKSVLIAYVCAHAVHTGQVTKTITVVPQLDISRSFGIKQLYLNNGLYDWVPFDLCQDKVATARESMNSFLAGGEQHLICSHSSLLACQSILENHPHRLRINIDEAHHIAIGDEITNRLGNLVRSIASRHSLLFTTATPFRTDKLRILPTGLQHARYALDYENYFRYYSPFKQFQFNYNFIPYAEISDTPQAIAHLFHEESELPTLIFIPDPQSLDGVSKTDYTAEIMRQIGKVRKNTSSSLITLPSGKVLTTVDLVDEEMRPEKRLLLGDGTEDDIDLIIALKMFNEGSNFNRAARCIIVGPRNSFRQLLQLIGRTFRFHPGKEEVFIYHLVPDPSQLRTGSEAFHKAATQYLNTVYAKMLLEQVLNPVRYFKRAGSKKVERVSRSIVDSEDSANLFIAVTEEALVKNADLATFKHIYLKHYSKLHPGATMEDCEELAEDAYVAQYRSGKANAGLDEGFELAVIDFSSIKESRPWHSFTQYMSGPATADTLKAMKESILRSKGQTHAYQEAKRFINEHFPNIKSAKSYYKWRRSFTHRSEHPLLAEILALPLDPASNCYGADWLGWPEFLGTQTNASVEKFYNVHQRVIAAGLKNWGEWSAWAHQNGIPLHPFKVYPSHWISFSHWLTGVEPQARPKDFAKFIRIEQVLMCTGTLLNPKDRTWWLNVRRTFPVLTAPWQP